MYEKVEKPKENKSRAVANSVIQEQSIGFVDNRSTIITQLKSQEIAVQKPFMVQRAVTKEMLDEKLNSSPDYQGTIDGETPWYDAILVGKDWVGSEFHAQKYGPPFDYQAVSIDGKRQFRPPMVKKQSQMHGQAQANYEYRPNKSGAFTFNAHATVPDINDYKKE